MKISCKVRWSAANFKLSVAKMGGMTLILSTHPSICSSKKSSFGAL